MSPPCAVRLVRKIWVVACKHRQGNSGIKERYGAWSGTLLAQVNMMDVESWKFPKMFISSSWSTRKKGAVPELLQGLGTWQWALNHGNSKGYLGHSHMPSANAWEAEAATAEVKTDQGFRFKKKCSKYHMFSQISLALTSKINTSWSLYRAPTTSSGRTWSTASSISQVARCTCSLYMLHLQWCVGNMRW